MPWTPPEPTTTVVLADGRRLACDDVGDPDGDVVVYLHGAPDCRLARHPDDGVAASLGIRLVAVDRPGYGASDADPELTFRSFAADAGELLDGIGVDRCRLLAWSAGAPWALAAATVLGPDRILAVTTYGCVPPFDALDDPDVLASSGPRADLALAVRAGYATPDEVADDIARAVVPTPPVPLELAREAVEEQLGPCSLAELAGVDGALDAMAQSLAAAVHRNGDAGLRRDVELQFSTAEAELLTGAPCPVRVVHGDADAICGPAVGRWLAARLADATLEVWPGAGHHAIFPRWCELLS